MDVQTAVIRAGEWPSGQVARVFLDGVEQRYVVAVDFVARTVQRGVIDPATNRAKFDIEADDFVLETVTGTIKVEWRDHALAKRWLAHHGIAAEPTN